MKQHITVEQLNELSDKGKERLREWWKPQYGDYFAYHYHTYKGKPKYKTYLYVDELGYDTIGESLSAAWSFGYKKDAKNRTLPLLSIGYMIEFLDKQNNVISWWHRINQSEIIHDTDLPSGDYLCDALWEAVKQVLDEEAI